MVNQSRRRLNHGGGSVGPIFGAVNQVQFSDLPRLSPLTARVFSTFQVAMEDVLDATMDAIQQCLMFEDRDETAR